MAKSFSARSGITRKFPVLSLMDRWAEPTNHGGAKNGWGLGNESFPGALRSSYAPLPSHSHRSPSLSALNEVSSLSLGARIAVLRMIASP